MRYTSLPPGHYDFEVRARFREGAWGPVTNIGFEIEPPWWSTLWARAVGIMLLLLLAYSGMQIRLRSLRQHTKQLESEVAARTVELASANEALRSQSLSDPLTGLRNRRYVQQILPEHITQVNRDYSSAQHQPVSATPQGKDLLLVMVDIDHFKSVNDEYGHAAGDRVLQQVADILNGCLRESDVVARWGGEEFLLIARNTLRSEAPNLVERIRTSFADHVFYLDDGRSLRRTCSMGFVLYPFVPTSPGLVGWEALVHIADQCLYVAKRNGRNAWYGVEPAVHVNSDSLKAELSNDLMDLIRAGHLVATTSLNVTVLSDG